MTTGFLGQSCGTRRAAFKTGNVSFALARNPGRILPKTLAQFRNTLMKRYH